MIRALLSYCWLDLVSSTLTMVVHWFLRVAFYIPILFAVTVFGLKTLDTCSSFSRTLWLNYKYPILRYTLTSSKDDKH